MNIQDIQKNVSRETYKKLRIYVNLLIKWNAKINLVSASTIPHIWERHVQDSLQLTSLFSNQSSWVDLGSGGGLPGLVIGCCKAEIGLNDLVLVESDLRKATFLRTVLREAEIPATIINQRIETAEPQNADVISARALADLSTLLEFSARHRKKDGICVFPKGKSWKKEIEEAQKQWKFDFDVYKSETDPQAVILKIGEFFRA